MKKLYSRLFFGIVIFYFVFFVILFAFESSHSDRVEDYLIYMVSIVIGIHVIGFTLRRYERGKKWAKVLSFISIYFALFFFIKDTIEYIIVFSIQYPDILDILGFVVDFVSIAGLAIAIVLMHMEKKRGLKNGILIA